MVYFCKKSKHLYEITFGTMSYLQNDNGSLNEMFVGRKEREPN